MGVGDAVLSAFLPAIFQAIAYIVNEELKSEGLESKSKTLISNVEMMQAVLRSAESMQLFETQKLLFGELKEVSYDAVEVLDKYRYEENRCRVIHLQSVRNNKVSTALNPKRQFFSHRMAMKINDVSMKIDGLLKALELSREGVHGETSQDAEGSSSSFPPPQDHCRLDDCQKIVNMLLHSDRRCNNVEVLPIIGDAYIGKTTVAQLVINDERISRYFEPRPWVHVSNKFDIKKITADIIDSIEGSPFAASNNLDNIQKHLEKLLRGRRYLLVLDDYWQRGWHDWEQLKRPLLSGAPGSRIIVTTRIHAVADDLRASARYELQGLAKEECWSLFCKYAQCDPFREIQVYGSGDFGSSSLMEEVVRKCKGVPFIAASLGHSLYKEKDRSKWAAILRDEKWESNPTDYMRSLHMNYAQLDSHLKPCFAYSSIFPQNFQFEEEWLIQHWMAQEFIQRPPNTTDMMANGKNYFRSFVQLSYFQRVHVGHTRERDRYSMPQQMQELSLHVSAGECCILGMPCNTPEKVRHLTVQFDKLDNENMFDAISQYTSLHTLLVVGGPANYQLRIPKYVLETTLQRLRVLDVSNFNLSELPKSIGDLIHLRYLQLRGTKIRRLPKSICDLYNLQTLGLRNCYHLEELPTKIKYIRKLRHIDLHMDDHESTQSHGLSYHICSLKHMPEGIGSLIDLQTLSRFVVSKRRTGRSSIHELSRLKNLSGELLISNLHLIRDAKEAAQAHLASKPFLRKLELSWSGNNMQDDKIIENLKPASTINELTVSGYVGMACPIWLRSANYMLHDLVTVRLDNFKRCSVLPSLGLLLQLKNLYLISWDELVSMDNDAYGDSSSVSFQSLKKFHLENMCRLQRWDWNESWEFPCLVELVVKNCPQLCELPQCIQNLLELEDMEIAGCRQLAHLPHMNALTSLQRLEISYCSSIMSLPSTGLPRSLQILSINNCHKLSESCMNMGRTVPSVWIDGKPIQ